MRDLPENKSKQDLSKDFIPENTDQILEDKDKENVKRRLKLLIDRTKSLPPEINSLIMILFPDIISNKNQDSSELNIRLFTGSILSFIGNCFVVWILLSFLVAFMPFSKQCTVSENSTIREEKCTPNPLFSNLVFLASIIFGSAAVYSEVALIKNNRKNLAYYREKLRELDQSES